MPDGINFSTTYIDADPVVALWPKLMAAKDALNADDENKALEERWADLDSRFVRSVPTTGAGVALLLKYLAHFGAHHEPDTMNTDEAIIIRTLVRLFGGDPSWTCPPVNCVFAEATEALAKPGKELSSFPNRDVDRETTVAMKAQRVQALAVAIRAHDDSTYNYPDGVASNIAAVLMSMAVEEAAELAQLTEL
jgi:hypothetical protein